MLQAEWENTRDAVLLSNPTIPGTKNAIRTSVNRLWLSPLVQTDPDVVYFRSRKCGLTEDQKSLLQDLALICDFKATSDMPQWLAKNERERLAAFLEAKPEAARSSRYVFRLGDRIVDFSHATPLPERPRGLHRLESILVGWLGNSRWALRIMDRVQKNELSKTIERSNISGPSWPP